MITNPQAIQIIDEERSRLHGQQRLIANKDDSENICRLALVMNFLPQTQQWIEEPTVAMDKPEQWRLWFAILLQARCQNQPIPRFTIFRNITSEDPNIEHPNRERWKTSKLNELEFRIAALTLFFEGYVFCTNIQLLQSFSNTTTIEWGVTQIIEDSPQRVGFAKAIASANHLNILDYLLNLFVLRQSQA